MQPFTGTNFDQQARGPIAASPGPRGHRRPRRLLVLLAALGIGLLALLPAKASAWTSNDFSSPTRNIQCHNGGSWLACTTLNNGRVVSVSLYGHAYSSYDQSGFGYGGPTLYYGQTYNAPGRFRCISRFNGMTCTSLR